MSPLRWLSGLMLALALVAGAALLLQRQAAAQLRGEIALLREANRELVTLRAENTRLVAAQPAAAQLEAMRADHAAVLRLRGEIEKLKAETERQARAVALANAPLIPAGEWKNAGRATPAATVETLLWAASHYDIDTLAAMLTFDAQLRPAVDRLFAVIPPALQAQYGTVERLMAESLPKDFPLAAMRIIESSQTDPDRVIPVVDPDRATLVVRVQNTEGGTREIPFTMQHGNEGWALSVSPQAVQETANRIGRQLQAAR